MWRQRPSQSIRIPMSHSLNAVALPRFATVVTAAKQPRLRPNPKPQNGKKKITTTNPSVPPATAKKTTSGFNIRNKELRWQCIQNCGACCKLDKDPNFPSPEEIFDDPSDIELFNSMVGSDGWCIHFEKSTRKCSIYADRPYFCRVEPAIFETLYGIEEKKFNKEACSSCIDTIKAIYGSSSKELENYNAARYFIRLNALWSLSCLYVAALGTTLRFCTVVVPLYLHKLVKATYKHNKELMIISIILLLGLFSVFRILGIVSKVSR